ncbi:MAG: hypothetical protein U0798_04465 [Gemmataceae bacterium]
MQLSAETPDGQIRVVRFGNAIRVQLDHHGIRHETAVTQETLSNALEKCRNLEIETVSQVSRNLLNALLQKLPVGEFEGSSSFELPKPIIVNETRNWQVHEKQLTTDPFAHSQVVFAPLSQDTASSRACETIVSQIVTARIGVISKLYQQLVIDVSQSLTE